MRARRIFLSTLLLWSSCGGGGDGDGGGTVASDTRFVALGTSTSTISLAWLPLDGATGYTLERDGQPLATLGADARAHLDGSLAAGRHVYRLTAVGVGETLEAAAETGRDAPVQTTVDPPAGELARGAGTVAVAGGAVRVEVPAGALPDGAMAGLQAIAAPTGDGDLAVELTADAPFALPVTLVFATGDDEARNLALAVKRADGTWVTAPAALAGDGKHLLLTLPADPPGLAKAPIGPVRPRDPTRVVRLRKVVIHPTHSFVKKSTKTLLKVMRRFSDEPCAAASVEWWCQAATYGHAFPEPVTIDREVRNAEGEWKNYGEGQIFADPQGSGLIHSAPPYRPVVETWRVTFSLKDRTMLVGTSIFVYAECLAPNQKAPEDTCNYTWQGTSTTRFTDVTPLYQLTADVKWEYDVASSTEDVAEFYPVGTVHLESSNPCITYSPDTYSFNGDEKNGSLTVDSSGETTTFEGAAASFFPATFTDHCGDPPSSGSSIIGGPWFFGTGTVAEDGVTIAGTTSGGGQTYTYRFERQR